MENRNETTDARKANAASTCADRGEAPEPHEAAGSPEAASSATGRCAGTKQSADDTAEDDALTAEIARYLDSEWDQVVDDIDALVRIPSVEDLDYAQPGAPFGPEPHRALEAGLSIAKRMGFDAHDCAGYIGYADFPGASDKQLGIIGHTDVVPAGPGWTFEPYQVTRKDRYLLGRGTSDDKGPLVVALHAVNFWKRLLSEKPQVAYGALGLDGRGNAGEPADGEHVASAEEPSVAQLPYTVRILFGSNEETSMRDVAYYHEHFADPAFLFTPDAEFPVCYGESGICSGWLVSKPLEGGSLMELSGGAAVNAVPGHARAVVRTSLEHLVPAEHISLADNGNGTVTIDVTGKSAHATLPEQGLNAIALLVNYLLMVGVLDIDEREYLQLAWALLRSTDGSAIGIDARDDEFGPLSCVGGIIALEDAPGSDAAHPAKRIRQSFDFRYPTTTSAQKIADKINELAPVIGAEFVLEHDKEPFLMAPDSPAVQALLSAYNEVTGENAKPFTMKGGTYARMFANGASFGPDKPWEEKPAWVGGMHGPDEGIREGLLKDAFAIYVRTIGKLMRIDW